jgi:hypothetical protein
LLSERELLALCGGAIKAAMLSAWLGHWELDRRGASSGEENSAASESRRRRRKK